MVCFGVQCVLRLSFLKTQSESFEGLGSGTSSPQGGQQDGVGQCSARRYPERRLPKIETDVGYEFGCKTLRAEELTDMQNCGS